MYKQQDDKMNPHILSSRSAGIKIRPISVADIFIFSCRTEMLLLH